MRRSSFNDLHIAFEFVVSLCSNLIIAPLAIFPVFSSNSISVRSFLMRTCMPERQTNSSSENTPLALQTRKIELLALQPRQKPFYVPLISSSLSGRRLQERRNFFNFTTQNGTLVCPLQLYPTRGSSTVTNRR